MIKFFMIVYYSADFITAHPVPMFFGAMLLGVLLCLFFEWIFKPTTAKIPLPDQNAQLPLPGNINVSPANPGNSNNQINAPHNSNNQPVYQPNNNPNNSNPNNTEPVFYDEQEWQGYTDFPEAPAPTDTSKVVVVYPPNAERQPHFRNYPAYRRIAKSRYPRPRHQGPQYPQR